MSSTAKGEVEGTYALEGGVERSSPDRASSNFIPRPLSNSAQDVESAPSPPIQPPAFQDQQSNILPHKELMIVFPVIALVQFTAYLDQTSVSAALPSVSHGLNLGPSSTWVATSYLLATTVVQLVYGRLSDIFGRKQLLLISLGMLAAGNLVTGFSQNSTMLFVFRAFSGLGGGAITALVQIIASDITTLKQRGKYNGFIGAAVSLGSGLGPLIGGIATTKLSWRWTFWYDVPWLLFMMCLIIFLLPKGRITGGAFDKLKLIDWAGVLLSVTAITLLLIPLSEGGTSFSWKSSIVIAMLAVSGVVVGVFLLVEHKFAKLPIMPLRLFTNDLSCNILLVQNVLFGFVFWGNLFYMPIYLENVRRYSPIASGAMILPMVGAQGIGSIISGVIISKTGHYNPVMIASQFLWAIGLSIQTAYSASTPIWAIAVVGFFQGLGTGGCFQPSLIAILAHSRREDRAVLNSLRNFLRTIGGSAGLTISGLVLNNVLKKRLRGVIPSTSIDQLSAAAYELDTMGLSGEQTTAILRAYMDSIHIIFYLYAPLIGVCAIGALLVRDHGVAEKNAKAEVPPARNITPLTISSPKSPQPGAEPKIDKPISDRKLV